MHQDDHKFWLIKKNKTILCYFLPLFLDFSFRGWERLVNFILSAFLFLIMCSNLSLFGLIILYFYFSVIKSGKQVKCRKILFILGLGLWRIVVPSAPNNLCLVESL